eukprot:INCI11328.2.p1 GENE.INCI11328.2~~INCI11328.2.p1  ORF type:complete len:1033 (+),score=158.85 INCI11328.2:452-3100(+)
MPAVQPNATTAASSLLLSVSGSDAAISSRRHLSHDIRSWIVHIDMRGLATKLLWDPDADGLPIGWDLCPHDPLNDVDSDGQCELTTCFDNLVTGTGHFDCVDYAPFSREFPHSREGFCVQDRMCTACSCTCYGECHSAGFYGDMCPNDDGNDHDQDMICDSSDLCPLDKDNDADSDGLCALSIACYSVSSGNNDVSCDRYDGGGDLAGRCTAHDTCFDCPCACASECNLYFDVCPKDSLNDADGDGICGNLDSCPEDGTNDWDGDNLCFPADPCPRDALNDDDSDLICDSDDSCPDDAANDLDGDGMCNNLTPWLSTLISFDLAVPGVDFAGVVGAACDVMIGLGLPCVNALQDNQTSAVSCGRATYYEESYAIQFAQTMDMSFSVMAPAIGNSSSNGGSVNTSSCTEAPDPVLAVAMEQALRLTFCDASCDGGECSVNDLLLRRNCSTGSIIVETTMSGSLDTDALSSSQEGSQSNSDTSTFSFGDESAEILNNVGLVVADSEGSTAVRATVTNSISVNVFLGADVRNGAVFGHGSLDNSVFTGDSSWLVDLVQNSVNDYSGNTDDAQPSTPQPTVTVSPAPAPLDTGAGSVVQNPHEAMMVGIGVGTSVVVILVAAIVLVIFCRRKLGGLCGCKNHRRVVAVSRHDAKFTGSKQSRHRSSAEGRHAPRQQRNFVRNDARRTIRRHQSSVRADDQVPLAVRLSAVGHQLSSGVGRTTFVNLDEPLDELQVAPRATQTQQHDEVGSPQMCSGPQSANSTHAVRRITMARDAWSAEEVTQEVSLAQISEGERHGTPCQSLQQPDAHRPAKRFRRRKLRRLTSSTRAVRVKRHRKLLNRYVNKEASQVEAQHTIAGLEESQFASSEATTATVDVTVEASSKCQI